MQSLLCCSESIYIRSFQRRIRKNWLASRIQYGCMVRVFSLLKLHIFLYLWQLGLKEPGKYTRQARLFRTQGTHWNKRRTCPARSQPDHHYCGRPGQQNSQGTKLKSPGGGNLKIEIRHSKKKDRNSKLGFKIKTLTPANHLTVEIRSTKLEIRKPKKLSILKRINSCVCAGTIQMY